MIARFDDPDFATAYRAGNRSALSAVFREYSAPLECYLRRNFVFQKWEMSDAIQETFLRAFTPEARNAYDCTRPFKNYLFTIARNIFLNEVNRPFRFREVSVEDLDCNDFGDTTPDPSNMPGDRTAEISELGRHIEEFRTSLSEPERLVLETGFLGGESTLATAAKLGLSRQNVRTLEKSIRKKAYRYFRAAGFSIPAAAFKVALFFFLSSGWGAADLPWHAQPSPASGGEYESR